MGKEQLAKEATTINTMEIWLLDIWVRCSVVTWKVTIKTVSTGNLLMTIRFHRLSQTTPPITILHPSNSIMQVILIQSQEIMLLFKDSTAIADSPKGAQPAGNSSTISQNSKTKLQALTTWLQLVTTILVAMVLRMETITTICLRVKTTNSNIPLSSLAAIQTTGNNTTVGLTTTEETCKFDNRCTAARISRHLIMVTYKVEANNPIMQETTTC